MHAYSKTADKKAYGINNQQQQKEEKEREKENYINSI